MEIIRSRGQPARGIPQTSGLGWGYKTPNPKEQHVTWGKVRGRILMNDAYKTFVGKSERKTLYGGGPSIDKKGCITMDLQE
jgi:hypothetical protein